jgi:hypothetical protein
VGDDDAHGHHMSLTLAPSDHSTLSDRTVSLYSLNIQKISKMLGKRGAKRVAGGGTEVEHRNEIGARLSNSAS